MTGENAKTAESIPAAGRSGTSPYDPFATGPLSVGLRTMEARDSARDRIFPVAIWFPEATSGLWPVILYSHPSGGHRRSATFLCAHLASHGYVVAALDHSEIVAQDLAPKPAETAEQRAARAQAWIASRVPDLRFLLDYLLAGPKADWKVAVDPALVGVVGHSFGGWTALAAVETDSRIRSVVALAPGGSSRPKPGILPLTLNFNWGRDVPAMYLAAENDVATPLDGIRELFGRTPSRKSIFVLRRADHSHFMDDVEQQHERIRNMPFTGDLAWIPKEMRPASELCSGDQAHRFARALVLSHFDATLKCRQDAQQFLEGDVRAALASRGVDALVPEQAAAARSESANSDMM